MSSTGHSRSERIGLLRAQQSSDWRRGERRSVEVYLQQHPEVATDAEAVLDLIYNEVLLREECGERPTLPEYQERFPQYAEPLQRQFHLHAALADASLGTTASGLSPQQGDSLPTLPAPAPNSGTLAQSPADMSAARKLALLTSGELGTTYQYGQPGTPGAATHPFIGPRISGYEILEELGRGGMGVVYKARDLALNRLVALKLLLAGPCAAAEQVRRFRQEAEAVARLQHPNIVQIYEIGEHNGLPYLALEYCAGGSLSAHLQGQPLPPREAAQLIETLARAVHTAHLQHIIHRDLKPANILLARSTGVPPVEESAQAGRLCYEPKITDFGLARNLDEVGRTHTGDVMGTPSYMPPEQAQGRIAELGPAADIYALGATLYDLLTGRPPFKGPSVLDTITQVLHDEPVPPARLQSGTPRDLETICLACLRKDPGRRYPTALALAEDLRRFLEDRPIQARPVSLGERAVKWVRRRPAIAALAALVLLTTALGFAGVTWGWRQAVDQRRQTLAALADAEGQLYFNRIALADREWLAGNVGRMEELLELCPPRLRGWEWRYLHCLGHTELLTLPGGDTVAFSPDGTNLLLARGPEVQIRDATSGQEVLTLPGTEGRITRALFSPDGKQIATATDEGTVQVVNAATGAPVMVWRGLNAAVTGLAFSPDGQRLAASAARVVQVGEVGTGQVLQTLEGHTGLVTAVTFTGDGRQLASSSWDHTVKLWDLTTGKVSRTLIGHTGKVTALAPHPEGLLLASGSEDQTVRLWDLATGQEVRTLYSPDGPMQSVAFGPHGEFLVSADGDFDRPGELNLWETATGRLVRVLRGPAGRVRRVAFDPKGGRVASIDGEALKVWDITRDQEARTLRGHSRALGGVAVNPDGRSLASAGGDGLIKIWDTASGREVRALRGHTGAVASVAFAPDGRSLASAGDDHTVRLWDLTTGQEVHTLSGHTAWVWAVTFSPDGKRLASASADETVRLWDATTGQEQACLRGHTNRVSSVAFSPNGRTLASASADQTVKLWDVATQAELRTLRGHTTAVSSVAFSPDGKLLASGGGGLSQGEILVWDATTGQALHTLHGHQGRVLSVTFSTDGKRLVSGGLDCGIKVWDPVSGQEVLTLRGHQEAVTGVVFGPGDSFLASASMDQTVRLWDAEGQAESTK